MERDRNLRVVIPTVVGLVALLVGCGLGTIAGVPIGMALGSRLGTRATAVQPAPLPERVTPEPAPESPDVTTMGALVMRVIENSPAQRAGLQEGDLITEVNGESVRPERPLGEIIGERRPGDRVSLTFLRRGRVRAVTVTLGTHPDQMNDRAWLGIEFLMVAPQVPFPERWF
jgi:membrane-associated protease RseP (regulator of RpoE activity)